ncbi:unnamed protein product [Closterium sp. Yama58-4]|nr:unnamed protein product [Closterium sp. Yama58-4]
MCALPLPHVAVDFRLPPAIPLSVDLEERDKGSALPATQRCGWGAGAAEPIKAGEFIVEYAGEVIDDAMCEARLWAMRAGGATDFYMCEVSRDVVIDATFRGGHGRFVNHSCAPNAELQKW